MQPSPAELLAIERYEALAQLWAPDAHLIRADPAAVGRLAVSVAECFIGVAEIGDSNTGFLINRWMLEIKVRPPAYWCLVAVQKWYQLVSEICGMPDLLPNNTASTQTLAADCERRGLTTTDRKLVTPGSSVIFTDGPASKWQGHIEMVAQAVEKSYDSIGGNTNSKTARNGGEVVLHADVPWEECGKVGVPKSSGRWTRCFIRVDALWEAHWKPLL
jgi:hypothetical protein